MTDVPLIVNVQTNVGVASDTVPDQITNWSVTNEATDGDARITISTAPDDGGQPITSYLYDRDSSGDFDWLSSAIGSFVVSGFTNGVSTDIRIIARNSIGDSTPSDPQPVTTTAAGSATVTISELSASDATDKSAPYGAWFECVVTGFDVSPPTGGTVYDETLHEIDYAWTFDEVGETYSAPVKLIPAHNDKNVGFAPRIGHVWTRPGTYDITVVATDRSGNTAQDTYQIVVGDADTHADFAGTRTIVVALDSDYTGAPAGAQTFNTLAAGRSAYESLGSTGRLLLKRGETHNISGDWRINDNYAANFRIGAWGTGAKPILDASSLNSRLFVSWSENGFCKVFDNINFISSWDEDDLSGSGQGTPNTTGLWVECSDLFVMSECDSDGVGNSTISMYARTGYVFINDLVATSFGGTYPIYANSNANAATLCVTGYLGIKSSLADGWYNNKGTSGNHHGPFRLAQVPKAYATAMDLFSKSSWPVNIGLDQPCIRLHTQGQGHNHYACFERNVMEGGNTIIAMGNAEGNGAAFPCNVIIQQNYMLGGCASAEFYSAEYGGSTVRDNIMVQSSTGKNSTPLTAGGGFSEFVIAKDAGADAENQATPVRVYNNTLINLQSDADESNAVAFVTNDGSFSDMISINNVEYSPNRTGGNQHTEDEPLTSVDLLPTARFLGLIWQGDPVLDAAWATPNGDALDYAPDTGSAALDDTAGVEVSHRDFYGNIRGANPDRGAIQTMPPAFITPNVVDNNGVALIRTNASEIPNTPRLEYSMWASMDVTAPVSYTLFQSTSNRLRVRILSGQIVIVQFHDDNDLMVWSIQSADPIPLGELVHVYVAIDLSVPSAILRINGVAVPIVEVVPIIAGSGTLNLDEPLGILSTSTSGNRFDGQVHDLYVDSKQIRGYQNFINGGLPLDISSFTDADILLTNDAAAWEAAANEGIISIFLGVGGFTDV